MRYDLPQKIEQRHYTLPICWRWNPLLSFSPLRARNAFGWRSFSSERELRFWLDITWISFSVSKRKIRFILKRLVHKANNMVRAQKNYQQVHASRKISLDFFHVSCQHIVHEKQKRKAIFCIMTHKGQTVDFFLTCRLHNCEPVT